ncbi:unnamed protein product [Protopolystoma xenopodis]|uniref:Uncharacterized protein n=1 Tax=Protopolystoma xenopodis TaxID=117903 RepID=A0A448XT01_9PLAT|nr:unnamed protein product [Protopolystoma xenopodis]
MSGESESLVKQTTQIVLFSLAEEIEKPTHNYLRSFDVFMFAVFLLQIIHSSCLNSSLLPSYSPFYTLLSATLLPFLLSLASIPFYTNEQTSSLHPTTLPPSRQ